MNGSIENLVKKSVFEGSIKAREEIRKRAKEQGIKLNSTQKLYEERSKNHWSGFTVPAINIRTLTFDVARSIFRQVGKKRIGAFIFELARSEIGYTKQEMSEYVSTILAAGLKEDFKGHLFFQGDHFQVKSDVFFSKKREREVDALKTLIKESIRAGVYNIDIDSSTLVMLEEKKLDLQQKYNYKLTAELASCIRDMESEFFQKNYSSKDPIEISIGGEIGEIGGNNSNTKELRSFMEGFNEEMDKLGKKKKLSKISVQTGASHGGIIDSSGKIVKANIDFKTLKSLSSQARKYGMGGAVQHGSSTLPEEYFDKFPETGAVEIHLATAFQNIVFDSLYFPQKLKEKMYEWVNNQLISKKREDQTEQQFMYRNRKKALGPFKEKIWQIPQENIDKISEELEEKFSLIFKKLGVEDTADLIEEIYSN